MDMARTSSMLSGFPPAFARLWAIVQNITKTVKMRRRERSLRVCETLSLGERRFLIVVQFERQRFLIGATSQSISLLQRLDDRHALSQGPEDSAPGVSLQDGTP
jgi:flagellar biogenesis protein FliO